MRNSADFEKQWQYLVKKNIAFVTKIIALSLYRFIAILLYRNIARQNRSSDEGLKQKKIYTFILGKKFSL
jgi:hypothetical protein